MARWRRERRGRWLGAFVIAAALVAGLGLGLATPQPVRAAAYTVNAVTDTGAGSGTAGDLRYVINQVNAGSGGDTVTFSVTGLITLTSTLTLVKDVTITGPASGAGVTVSGGGAVGVFFVNSGVTARLTNLTIADGSAFSGGGILNNGALTVTNSTLTGNRSTGGLGGGGGIFNSGGTLAVTNSTLTGNSASFGGGGIVNLAGTLTVTNSTLAGNAAANSGGGIANFGGTLNLHNTVVATNTALTALTGPDISGPVITTGNNLIGTTSGSTGITNGANGDIVTPTPLLGTLGNNGGPTPTIPLLAGSPAVGAGNPAVCSAAPVGGVDQRGLPRPAARCAIGAFEPQAATYTVGNTADTGAMASFSDCQNSGNTTCKLRDALAYASSGSDTVVFNSTGRGTITLTSTLTLATSVTVQGPAGGAGVTVSGGGAVQVFTVNPGVTARLANLTIADGRAVGGGGIYNGGTLTVTNSTLTGNSATQYGGGLYNAPGGTLTVTSSALAGNSAINGGGLYNNSGTLMVTNSALADNTASTIGGGIYNYGGPLTVTNSTLTGNAANTGGGLYNNSGTLTVTNSTLAGNRAGSGAGIYNNGPLTVTNSTLAGNAATNNGGGIDIFGGTLTVKNTLVATNTAANGPDIFGAVTTTGNNLVGTTSGSTGITNGVSGDLVTPTPLLGTLGNYGGPTQTIPLLPGSPALDAGDAATCAATGAGAVNNVDQRGITRPQGARCDIGAFESQGFTLAVVSGNNQSTTVGTAFAQPLVVRVTANGSGEPVDGGVVSFTGPASGAGIQGSPATAPLGTPASGQARLSVTANGTAGGPYNVTAATTGAGGTVTFSLTNNPPISGLTPTTLPNGVRGVPYPPQTFGITGGTPPATFALSAGALPPGLTLAAAGTLTGTPTTLGVFSFTVTATDASGTTGSTPYTLTVTAAPLVAIAVTPANVTLRVGQTQQYTAMGTYQDGTTADVTAQVAWASDTPAVVTVDGSGKATGVTGGTAQLTAQMSGVRSGAVPVTVTPPVMIGVQPPAPQARPGAVGTPGMPGMPSATPAPRPPSR